MEDHRRDRAAAGVLALALLASACSIGIREPRLHEPLAPPAAAGAPSALKVHFRSGELLVLTGWQVAASGDRLAGEGQAYTVAREKRGEPRRHDVSLAEVALLETSSPETVSSAGLGLICSSVEGNDAGGCAGFGAGMAAAWALVGFLAAPSLEASSQISLDPESTRLKPYARLPAGLPKGVSLASLEAGPPAPK